MKCFQFRINIAKTENVEAFRKIYGRVHSSTLGQDETFSTQAHIMLTKIV